MDFWNVEGLPNNPKRIGIGLSSGTDSALLLYITALHFKDKDVQIIPVTGNRVGYEEDTPIASKIIEIVRNKFPTINILDTEDHTYTKKYPEPAIKYDEKDFVERNKIDVFLHGKTLSPDEDWANEGADSNHPIIENRYGVVFYYPFVKVNKKWIAEMYHKYDLMKDLFPITISCISKRDIDKKGPCKQCYWCKEKHWAFGCYDRGIL